MALSPMMKHYKTTKEKYPDCLLFYRLGDFYEMFFEDAKIASQVLDLTLTGRDCGLEERAPMCGVPFHAVDNYIQKLIQNGYKVAICEQLTQPGEQEGLVVRDVVRVVTSGTATEDTLLVEDENNYIISLNADFDAVGFACCDLSTGEFFVGQFDGAFYQKNLSNFLVKQNAKEIICNHKCLELQDKLDIIKYNVIVPLTQFDESAFQLENSTITLQNQFQKTVSKLNLTNKPLQICSAGALLKYFSSTQMQAMRQINKLSHFEEKDTMQLDYATFSNLEIIQSVDGKRKNSLLWLLDKTKTSFGARQLANWLKNPLKDKKKIEKRLNAVEELSQNVILRENLLQNISQIKDLERLATKISLAKILPTELVALKDSLQVLPQIVDNLKMSNSEILSELQSEINFDFTQYVDTISNAINPDYMGNITQSGYILRGYSLELDQLIDISQDGKKWLSKYEQEERENTKIKNLKIGYNKVFGYYIELTKSTISQAPYYFIRKQTLVNCERYVTQELKEMEAKILNAEEEYIKLETQIYQKILKDLFEIIPFLQTSAKALAQIDCLLSFCVVATENNYCKPKILDFGKKTYIKEGRHPTVEKNVKNFISNDTFLQSPDDLTMIITGPNMAGKSTYMRQVALIVLLAHLGSFVPANEAEIALCDRIFTRIGASDNLNFNQSTFMLEMLEVANILENATSNSLIILDEVGRGTSTFDGLSIAWAVVDYLAKHTKAKTLFSTHYHELTELEGNLQGVKNYQITVKETENSIIFLRKIARGGCSRSFGIEVANLAGLPQVVISKAKKILNKLQKEDINNNPTEQITFDKID